MALKPLSEAVLRLGKAVQGSPPPRGRAQDCASSGTTHVPRWRGEHRGLCTSPATRDPF